MCLRCHKEPIKYLTLPCRHKTLCAACAARVATGVYSSRGPSAAGCFRQLCRPRQEAYYYRDYYRDYYYRDCPCP